MRDIWVISDTHFGHENIIKYCDRPFKSSDEMTSILIDNWNSRVKDEDIVYHLGDVYYGSQDFGYSVLKALKGRKRLILGNHDIGQNPVLLNCFQKILMWRMFPEFEILMTHVPVHESTLGPRKDKRGNSYYLKNVHGHTHLNEIKDRRYKNVCVEKTNYTPINIEELKNNG